MRFDKTVTRNLTTIEIDQLQTKLDRAKVLVGLIDNSIQYAVDTSEYEVIKAFVNRGEVGTTKESKLTEDQQRVLTGYFEELKGLYDDLK